MAIAANSNHGRCSISHFPFATERHLERLVTKREQRHHPDAVSSFAVLLQLFLGHLPRPAIGSHPTFVSIQNHDEFFWDLYPELVWPLSGVGSVICLTLARAIICSVLFPDLCFVPDQPFFSTNRPDGLGDNYLCIRTIVGSTAAIGSEDEANGENYQYACSHRRNSKTGNFNECSIELMRLLARP